MTKIASDKSSSNLVSVICFNVFRNGIEGACGEHKKAGGGDFSGGRCCNQDLDE